MRFKLFLGVVLLVGVFRVVYSAVVVPGSNALYTSGENAKLDNDHKHRYTQQRPVVVHPPGGSTFSYRGGDDVTLEPSDFCGNGANTLVCTGTDNKISSTVLPTDVMRGTGTTNYLPKKTENGYEDSRVIDNGTNIELRFDNTDYLSPLMGVIIHDRANSSNQGVGLTFESYDTSNLSYVGRIVNTRIGSSTSRRLDFIVRAGVNLNSFATSDIKLSILDSGDAILYGRMSLLGETLRGSTSGSLARQASATGGVTTLVEPSAPPTAVGQVLAVSSLATTSTATNTATLEWRTISSGGTLSVAPPVALSSGGTITETVTNTGTSTGTYTRTATGTSTSTAIGNIADNLGLSLRFPGTTGKILKLDASGNLVPGGFTDSGTYVEAIGSIYALSGIVQGFFLYAGVQGSSIGKVRLFSGSAGGSVALNSPTGVAYDIDFSLPNADGVSGDCLHTNGSGGWYFAACATGSGGTITGSGTANTLAKWASASSLNNATSTDVINTLRYTPVPTTRTVCGHALTSDVTCSASDVGAPPTSRTVCGHALTSDVTCTASDVGALPTTTVHSSTEQYSNLTSDISATGSGWTNAVTGLSYSTGSIAPDDRLSCTATISGNVGKGGNMRIRMLINGSIESTRGFNQANYEPGGLTMINLSGIHSYGFVTAPTSVAVSLEFQPYDPAKTFYIYAASEAMHSAQLLCRTVKGGR